VTSTYPEQKERKFMHRIESLLSARLFLTPQLAADRLYFLSNLSGKISLYAMHYGGSVPEPLLPPDIALQNPHLMNGYSFYVLPNLGKILVMIDADGDENYQPTMIPLDGGYPETAFGEALSNYRVHLFDADREKNLVYFSAESRSQPVNVSFRGNLNTGELRKIAESAWGAYVSGVSEDHNKLILTDGYSVGDNVLYLWENGQEGKKLLFGKPLEDRKPDEQVPLNAIYQCVFTPNNGVLFTTALFDDRYGLGYFKLAKSGQTAEPAPIEISGLTHRGEGELTGLNHLIENRFSVEYNIDGCSWLYESTFDEDSLTMRIDSVICGQGELANGVLEAHQYDKSSDRYALSFSTATSPTQIYTVEGKNRAKVVRHTNEKVLGIPDERLSLGEDASFTSFDGTRMSARLYLPAESLRYEGPRPVIYYVHGGPQGQDRPDFAWFSMPLIQFLTLNGFAVFVPNVRGSTGYGLSFTKEVDRDWGGKDRLDHVYAIENVLPNDQRIDLSRAGVVGRSYGGYMSLTLAGRHPDLWAAAVDMFGPYDLLTFSDRIPETWKPYFKIALGDPETEKDFLAERSPRTYVENIDFPLLVIQGKNDPRVVERESFELVENLRSKGKTVDYLMFENEGHDVLKFENRVKCYNAITDFFKTHLQP
jgi:pimeloyl-ACP methyl ester carboxylesterase